MDPNEALRSFREHVKNAREATTNETHMREMALAIENAEALDEWLTKGGFQPDDWQASGNPTKVKLVCAVCGTDDPECSRGCVYD